MTGRRTIRTANRRRRQAIATAGERAYRARAAIWIEGFQAFEAIADAFARETVGPWIDALNRVEDASDLAHFLESGLFKLTEFANGGRP